MNILKFIAWRTVPPEKIARIASLLCRDDDPPPNEKEIRFLLLLLPFLDWDKIEEDLRHQIISILGE